MYAMQYYAKYVICDAYFSDMNYWTPCRDAGLCAAKVKRSPCTTVTGMHNTMSDAKHIETNSGEHKDQDFINFSHSFKMTL